MKKDEATKEELLFPVDEVKKLVKWEKGYDFMDGTPRYTFENRDPATTYERFQVVIYVDDKKYYGYVLDNKLEYNDIVGPFSKLVDAKRETLSLFNYYIERFLLNHEFDDSSL